MKQVIVIHGGTTFKKYEDFLAHLASKTVYIERLQYKPQWKELLQENLGSDYQVLLPSMPNPSNARYAEWKLWFERLTEVLYDDVTLVGHSLGGIFLAKYLSENKLPIKIAATILIAAPFDDESLEDLTDFKITNLSPVLTEQAGRLVFFNGKDDPVISWSDCEKYQKVLPTAEFKTLTAPDHFVRADFPELVSLLKEV